MSKRTEKLRKKLIDGNPVSGIWMALASPMAAEIIADTGLDFAVLDAEHNPFSPETLLNILMAFRGSDTVPMLRVPWNDAVMIKQGLDLGYEGIVTPQTNTAEEARKAVDACRYPPLGTRGFGPMRPTGYYRDGGEYLRTANQSIICAIQIENVSGAHDIENIVKVPGVDWILIGRYDLSATIPGIFGEVDHPKIWEAVKKITMTARKAGIPVGCPPRGPEEMKKIMETGSNIVFLGQDWAFLRTAADSALKKFHAIVKDKP